MELFAIKSDENELYFQLEKTVEGLEIIDEIAGMLFGGDEFYFDMEWQSGFPETEDYLGYELNGIYICAIVSERKLHLIIRGLKDKDKINSIKEFIFEKYDFSK